MQMVQPDISSRPEQGAKTPGQFQQQLEDRIHALKSEVSEQPFLCLAVAFGAGVESSLLVVGTSYFVVRGV
jgi:hypothetical protein